MNKSIFLSIVLFFMVLSCGESKQKNTYLLPDTLVPIDGFDDDPLGIVQSFSEGLSIKEHRISAFVKTNRRVSIIDTELLREKWGRTLEYEFSRSFPIPNLDGVFLISDERMLFVTENEEHLIDLQGSRYNRYARAEQKAVYLAMNNERGDFLIARREEGTGITEQNFNINYPIPNSSSGTSDYSNSFVPFIDKLANRVLVLEQNTGAYFIFDSLGSEFNASTKECLPAKFQGEEPVPEEDYIRLVAGSLSSDGSKLLFATEKGRLGYIGITEDCQDLYTASESGVDLGNEVKRIVPTSDNRFLVVQSDNLVKEFMIEGHSFSEVSSVSSQCPEITVTANYLSDSRLLSVCLNSGQSYDGKYFAVEFIVSEPASQKIIYTQSVNNKKMSGVAIDKDQSKIFLIGNDAIGRVEQVQYETNEMKVNDSFYTEGLLNRL